MNMWPLGVVDFVNDKRRGRDTKSRLLHDSSSVNFCFLGFWVRICFSR